MMKRKLAFLILILLAAWRPASATTAASQNLWCQLGGQQVALSGLLSSTYVQASYPSCLVSVYLSGTSTLATIYRDANNTPLDSQFTANTDGSFQFWADVSQTYDVVTSSAGFPSAFTYHSVVLGGGTGGGGGGSGDATSLLTIPLSFNSLLTGNLLEYNGASWVNFVPIWCPLTGCTFTGNVVLSGNAGSALNPVPLQQLTPLLAAKADLVAGLVPTVELGANSANAGTFLRGDQTWATPATTGGAGIGTCTNQVVTGLNATPTPPSCTTVNANYVDPTSVEILSHKNVVNGYVGIDTGGSITVSGNGTFGGVINTAGPFGMQSPLPASTPFPSPGLLACPLSESCWGFDIDGYLKEWPNSAATPVKLATQTGVVVNGHIAAFDANGNIIDGGAAGAGNVSSSTLTAGFIPKATGAAAIANSLLDDGISTANTLTYTGTGGESLAGNLNFSGASPIIATSTVNADLQLSPNGTGGVLIPTGATTKASLKFNGDTAGAGWLSGGAGIWGYTNGTNFQWIFGGTGVKTTSNRGLLWVASSANANGTTDTGLSRVAVGVVSVDTGSINNGSGMLRSANSSRQVTTDYTNATTTPSNVFTWTFPSTALNWNFRCDMVWQGSVNTATLKLSINAAQAPSYEMATAQIFSDNVGTNTSTTATSSSSGNVPVLTGAAPLANATNYQARIYGSIEASATGGTFSIAAAAGGVGTVTILRGSACTLY